MTELQAIATSPQPSRAALRMRRLRERRRRGSVCFMIDLPPWAISGLVELRWLDPRRRADHAAVIDAFHRFVGYALDMTRNAGQ